jgi:hypothetical protein
LRVKVWDVIVANVLGTDHWWEENAVGQMRREGFLEPREMKLKLVDAESMEEVEARCLVCADPARLSAADLLRLRDLDTFQYVDEWAVKVLERLEEPEVKIEVRRDNRRLSQRKGDILKSLLAERQG